MRDMRINRIIFDNHAIKNFTYFVKISVFLNKYFSKPVFGYIIIQQQTKPRSGFVCGEINSEKILIC